MELRKLDDLEKAIGNIRDKSRWDRDTSSDNLKDIYDKYEELLIALYNTLNREDNKLHPVVEHLDLFNDVIEEWEEGKVSDNQAMNIVFQLFKQKILTKKDIEDHIKSLVADGILSV